MRAQPTKAEAMLWERLRDRRLAGWKFRRQHPVGTSVFDFYCARAKLIIEVDGPIHDDRHQVDRARDASSVASGHTIVRVRNRDVVENMGEVLRRIRTALRANPEATQRG
jgi:very-short-patch-repair endonuclease